MTGDALRIGNCSGFYGDRMSAMRDMLTGADLDVLTGDYLAELTMAILARDQRRDPLLGYARTFLRQLESCLGEALSHGVRIVANAGGLNPSGLAAAVRALSDELGLPTVVAHVEGDDLRARSSEFGLGPPDAANAYLGAFGIAECLRAGADVVVTGRVTDAALVVGPAIAHFGWTADDLDALAGAVVAGHVIECGPQAAGGNFAFFRELPDRDRPIGFPIAEVHQDGTSVITKHPGTGGAITTDTVTAQLLYEIDGPRYLGPDVTARFDTVQLRPDGPDRVRISGTRGDPPPGTLKVGVAEHGGFRNEMTFVLTGLDIEAKADWVRSQLSRLDERMRVEWTLARTDHPDAPVQEEAAALLHCVVRGSDPDAVGRAFSSAAVELALASYPGFFVTTPPGDAVSYANFSAVFVDRALVHQVAVLPDGSRREISSTGPTATAPPTPELALAGPVPTTARTVPTPLGRVFGTRSGDKGGTANLGVWARSEPAFAWLVHRLDVAALHELLPETATHPTTRHVLPNLRAVNFVITGLLGEGAAYRARHDPQAKALGEWLGSRLISIPEDLLP